MTHKYITEEIDAQKQIRDAGFPISLDSPRVRTGGPDYNPTFSEGNAVTLYAIDGTDDTKLRRDTGVAKIDKILMVSTEGITDENRPSVGTGITIAPTAEFPGLPSQSFHITEIRSTSPAGVPVFYIFVLDGI